MLIEKREMMKKKKSNANLLVKLGDFITNFKYLFLVIFIGLAVFCFFNINNVDINESIVSYLPDDTETKQGIDIMEKEFGELNTIKLMVNKISVDDAINLQSELSKIDKIDSVLFSNDENSYKDETALYTLIIGDLTEKELDNIKEDVDKIVSNDYDIYSETFEDTTDGVSTALVIAVIIIVVILLITSKTYFEPIIAFIIFGISIILNMGSNFLLGEISYITKAIAVILQLALSIDYVIIFMNQFMKEIDDTNDKSLAIKKTLSKSMPEIFASSLTTVAGLLALTFMQLKIGGDIGVVLAKGIICSLLTVIFVMPSLLFIFEKLIVKLKKKEKTKNTNKIGDIILKSRKITLPIFIILIIISIFLVPNYDYVYNDSSANSIKLSDNIKALNKIEDKFGASNTLVVLVKNENKDYSKELELVNELKDNEKIKTITSIGGFEINENIYLGTEVNYLELSQIFNIEPSLTLNLYQFYANENNELEKLQDINNYKVSIIKWIYFINTNQDKLPLDEKIKLQVNTYFEELSSKSNMLESEKYTRILLDLDTPVESEETYELIDEIRETTEKHYDDVILIGSSINALDLGESFTSDNVIITGITIIFIAIILLFTFKSIPIAILLILTIEGSILINFAIVSLMNIKIFFMAYVVVSAIQMGATIDYAIVVSNRYLQLRKKTDKKEALVGALNDRLPAVITSGLILLIAGFLIGFISTSPVISSIGLFLGLGTLISLLATILCLPAILYLFDKFIIK